MRYLVVCPHCGKRSSLLPDDREGSRLICAACGAQFDAQSVSEEESAEVRSERPGGGVDPVMDGKALATLAPEAAGRATSANSRSVQTAASVADSRGAVVWMAGAGVLLILVIATAIELARHAATADRFTSASAPARPTPGAMATRPKVVAG